MRAGRLVSITRASSHSARRLTGVIVGNDSPRDSQREASSSNTLPPYDPVKATLNAAKSENHAEREADPNPPAPQAPASEEAVGDESEAWCQRGLREKDKGNSTEALLWIRKSADAGYVLAQLVLAVAYQKGECGLESDHFKAFDWFLKAAQQGNAEAQYCVGMAFEEGRGAEKNPKAAVEWYRKAAKQDHAGALFEMAVNYMNETGGLKYDTEKGIVCTRKAAKLGNHQAQFNLGVMLYHGKGGVPLDEAKAVYWIRKSADQGYDLAQTLLGLLYYHGEASLPEDTRIAAFWLYKAADQGWGPAKEKIELYCLSRPTNVKGA
ncbi:Secretory immunoglobulin A-binding protein EsiB [Porphyridium purpureum]|uniref:Secretory immunoglobulin A-binding protein EsiB n=1 Tax=Porphyridium purpureum TaxID=35688 RepID=A0A5J4Z2K4_PORPP|nr:Secretory immunoglobulin A-binding protein EsiB [Porphyridium purpureum]|eukprot:POR7628..scf295_1